MPLPAARLRSQNRRWALALVVFGSAGPAQEPTPRFALPETPFDYAIEAPIGVAEVSFPWRNDPAPPAVQNARAALGRVLFYEPLLSRRRNRSCASCHRQERAFADGRRFSVGFARRTTRRNSMSLVNLAFHEGPLFWDGRTKTLEEVVLQPIEDPIEMGMTLEEVVDRLSAEPGYAELFEKAFATPEITPSRMGQALARFVRAIVSVRSRYDEGLASAGSLAADFANFSAAENRGKALFFGADRSIRQSCAGCHVVRAKHFCGTCWHIHPGLFHSEDCRNNGVDRGRAHDDPGLGAVTGEAGDDGKFRAPSLRNVAVTGPYMHDGRFATLEEVLEFYAKRMNAHANLDPVFDSGGPGWSEGRTEAGNDGFASIVSSQPGVPMDRREIADVAAFLGTLTDEVLLRDPRFSDPFVRR